MFCANLMTLAAVFQDLEHINDFQRIGSGDHFVFRNEAKNFHSQKDCSRFEKGKDTRARSKGQRSNQGQTTYTLFYENLSHPQAVLDLRPNLSQISA